MTYADVSQWLVDNIGSLGYVTLPVQPSRLDGVAEGEVSIDGEHTGVIVLLRPAGWEDDRFMGANALREYDQQLMVIAEFSEEPDQASQAITVAAERISALLDDNVTLGGHAASSTPVSWQPQSIGQYTAGSPPNMQQEGAFTVIVERAVVFTE